MPESIRILGVRVDDVTFAETLAWIDQFVADRKPHQIATLNPEFIVMAQKDVEFREILNASDLSIPDGIGLLWASRVLGQPLRERVTGSDLVPLLAERAAQRGYRLFFLGAAPGVAARAADILCERFPGLQITGTFAGSPSLADEVKIGQLVQAAQPDILCVAYGAPAQDKWIARNLNRPGVPVAIGIGGALDFIAGTTRRAPHWVQRLGLEWLHRLAHEPWRWKRQLRIPFFMWLVIQARFTRAIFPGTGRGT